MKRKLQNKKYLSRRNTRNIYVYYTAQNFCYKTVQAVDDNGHCFEYVFQSTDWQHYAEELPQMLKQFEMFCRDACHFTDSRFDDIWLLRDDLLPKDFCYLTMFDEATIHQPEVYAKNWKIYETIAWGQLDGFLGRVGWACINCVESAYGWLPHEKTNGISFEQFATKHSAGLVGTEAVKTVTVAYKKLSGVSRYFYEI